MVGAERRTEALLAQPFEIIPRRAARVPLKIEVPLARRALQVVGREPHPIRGASLVPLEELFAGVQPSERVLLALISGEGQLGKARTVATGRLFLDVQERRRQVRGGGVWRPRSVHDGREGRDRRW